MTLATQSQSQSQTQASPTALKYRIATTPKDLEVLKRFRIECGWGLEKIVKYFGDADRPFCIFSISPNQFNNTSNTHVNGDEDINENKNGDGVVDVGMGGWILDSAEDPEASNRLERKVNLSSLFIRPKYQKYGLGTKAMDLLESLAVSKYHARVITLDTTAFHSSPRSWPTPPPLTSSSVDGEQIEGEGEGQQEKQKQKIWFYEDFTKEGMSVAWYKARGYVRYRENKPTFPHPTPDDPHRKLTAMFLQKTIDDV